MKDSLTLTRDASIFDAPREGPGGGDGSGPVPRLRLLYHPDLARIGAVSHPDLAFEHGEWVAVGRGAPLFASPSQRDVWRPLEDPTISRTQLRIRWLREEACFEVEPSSSAKRRLHAIRLDAEPPPAGAEIRAPERLAPGSCVAIEDRVLLGLEATSRAHFIDEDRLGLIGESEEMWRLRADIQEVARFRKPALILGETGAGKELVASAVHQEGPSAAGPFKAINCAALPEQLVESMLFGHARGAFTGADASREGLFRAADGGTLFLDELGEMPIGVQPKLLRTLQDGLVTAVGQHQSVRVDVRLVAATNRDPAAEIAAGRLRADLYHRLAAHVVHVPSLAARRLDVPALFLHFLERLRRDHPEIAWLWRDGPRFRAAVPLSFFVELMRRGWEGNVRELENVAEQTARRNLREGPFQRPALPSALASLPPESPPSAPPSAPPSTAAKAAPAPPSAPPSAHLGEASQLLGIARKTVAKLLDEEALAAVLRPAEGDDAAARTARLRAHATERLHACLAQHDFSQARVARALGVSAWTLIRLMQDLGFPRPSDLSLAEIQRALDGAGGDLAGAAIRLRVSEHGLKKRLSEVGIERG